MSLLEGFQLDPKTEAAIKAARAAREEKRDLGEPSLVRDEIEDSKTAAGARPGALEATKTDETAEEVNEALKKAAEIGSTIVEEEVNQVPVTQDEELIPPPQYIRDALSKGQGNIKP